MEEKSIYNGCYFALSNGLIKTNNWRNTGKTAYLKPAISKKGYLQVGLQVNGKLISKRVHRIIAETFIPNPENKPMVNHINGIKTDNRIGNLEWCTAKENVAHAISMGLFVFPNPVNKIPKRGELNGVSILTDIAVKDIRMKFKPYKYTRKMLAMEYGVKEACIKDVILRKSWNHI